MKMIAPIEVTDAILTASNVTENDYPVWSPATTYADKARVIVLATHSIYESTSASNLGNDPTAEGTTKWVRVGSTNRWRAWDRSIGQSVTNAGSITYSLSLPGICNAVGFIGLSAGLVRVRVLDGDGVQIYDRTLGLVDATDIHNYFTYFTATPEYSPVAILEDIPGYTGYTMKITVDAGVGTAKVGEIVVGKRYELGSSGEGTEIGFIDPSRRERDPYGNQSVIARPTYDVVRYRFSIVVGGEERVRRILAKQGGGIALYYLDATLVDRGGTVLGYRPDFRAPLAAAGRSFAEIEIEGLP